MEGLEVEGTWWLPEARGRKLPGTLSFDPTSSMVRLTLNGQLFPVVDFDLRNPKEVSIVQGDVGGVAYTLQQCYAVHSYRFLLIDETVIDAIYIFKGHHFDAIEDIVFDTVTVSYPSLDEWIDQRKFQATVSCNKSRRGSDQDWYRPVATLDELAFLVTNVPFEPLEFYLTDDLGTRFYFKLTRCLPRQEESPAEWKSRARITIAPSKSLPFFGNDDQSDFAQLILFRLRDFFTLATGRVNDPQSIRGTVSGSGLSRSVSVYRSTLEPEFGFYKQPLFALDDVQDNISKYLTNWNKMYGKLGEVLELYFRWNHDLYHGRLNHTTTEFLNMARALEAYQRRLYDQPYIDEAEYKRKKKSVVKVIRDTFGEELSAKLIQDLAFGNRYSFAKRLESIYCDVLAELHGAFEEVICDFNIFKRTVADTRNDLTHVLEEPGKFAIRRDDLKSYHRYVTKMRILLRMCFLIEMDFPIGLVKRLISENRKHENLM